MFKSCGTIKSYLFFQLLLLINMPLWSHDLVNVHLVNPTIALNGYYQCDGHPWSHPCTSCNNHYFLMKDVARKLSFVQKDLQRDGIGLVLYKAYEPYFGTVSQEACPSLSIVSGYNRGVSVDVSIIYLDNQELEMPSEVYSEEPEASPSCCTLSGTAYHNRQRLCQAMNRFGFIQSEEVWWHFDYKWWSDYQALNIPLDQLCPVELLYPVEEFYPAEQFCPVEQYYPAEQLSPVEQLCEIECCCPI